MKQTISDLLQIGFGSNLGPSYRTYTIITEQVTDVTHRGVWESIRDVTLTWPQFRVLIHTGVKEFAHPNK